MKLSVKFFILFALFIGGCGKERPLENKGKKKNIPINDQHPELTPFKDGIALGKKLLEKLKYADDPFQTDKIKAAYEAKEILTKDDAPWAILWADDTRDNLIKYARKLGILAELNAALARLKIKGEPTKTGITNQGNTCYMNGALQAITYSNLFIERLNALQSHAEIMDKDPIERNLIRGLIKFFIQRRDPILGLNKDGKIDNKLAANKLGETALAILQATIKAGFEAREGQQADANEFMVKIMDILEIKTVRIEYEKDLYKNEKYEKSLNVGNEDHDALKISIVESGNLNELIELELAEKKYTGPDQIYLNGNEKSDYYIDKTFLHDLKKELFVLLGRLGYKPGGKIERVDKKVELPNDEVIDLSNFIPDKSKSYKYRIKAVVVHLGGAGGGHYIAYVRSENQWHLYNDSSHSLVDYKEVQKQNEDSYVLLLERI